MRKLEKMLMEMDCTYLEFAQISKASKGVSKNRTPRGAFYQQRRNAELRGIEWNLSMGQWWRIWQESGHWDQRGKGFNKYVMCRKNDVGPYAVGNVFIALSTENISSAKHKKSSLPIGVQNSENGKRYRARINVAGRSVALGTFDTPEEAHAEYIKIIKRLDEYKLVLDEHPNI